MTSGTSQGLFVVVAIVIFGIFVGLTYTLFGSQGLSNDLEKLVVNSTEKATYDLNTGSNYNPIKDSDIIYIQDADLVRAIKDNLGLSKESEITLKDMKNLKVLRANVGPDYDYPENMKITNINGLEYATNLEQLLLHGNAVESLEPIKNLNQLISINFNMNQTISDLTPLTNLVGLKVVMLGDNKYTDISPLKKLTNVTHLNIAKNNISDIRALNEMSYLSELHIHSTNVSDVSTLGNLKNLYTLHAYDTKVTDFSIVSGIGNLVIEDPSK